MDPDPDLMQRATDVFQEYVQCRFDSRDEADGPSWPKVAALVVLILSLAVLAVLSARVQPFGAWYWAIAVAGGFLLAYAVGIAAIFATRALRLWRPGAVMRITRTWFDFNRGECAADLRLLAKLKTFTKDDLIRIEMWLERWEDDVAWRTGSAPRIAWRIATVVFVGLVGSGTIAAAVAHQLPQLSLTDSLGIGALAGFLALVASALAKQPHDVLKDALRVVQVARDSLAS